MKTAIVRAKSAEVTEVLIYDMIGRDSFFGDGISAKEFREQIKAIKSPKINLRINSPGGIVFEASAMMNALDEHPARIEVDVDGLAASAASMIAMTGDIVRVAANGMFMIHNPWGMTIGGADDLRRQADLLDKMTEQSIDRYAKKSGASREQLKAWLDAETWFTGREAVEAGLADEVTGAVSVAAFAGAVEVMAKLKYRHAPALPSADAKAAEETRLRRERLAALKA